MRRSQGEYHQKRRSAGWHQVRATRVVLAAQALVTASAAAVVWVWDGRTALAVLLGGGACLVPTLLSARRAFSGGHSSRAAAGVLATLYRAETAKILSACGLMVLAWALWPEVPFAVLCVSFVVVQMTSALLALGLSEASGGRE